MAVELHPENLKSWKPGQSGNPKGKPKGTKSLKTRLRELMGVTISYTDLDGKPSKMKVEDALGIALVAKALTTGDIKAIEMIKNELEGTKPKEEQQDNLNEIQRQIVQRAMLRALPDFEKMKEVSK